MIFLIFRAAGQKPQPLRPEERNEKDKCRNLAVVCKNRSGC